MSGDRGVAHLIGVWRRRARSSEDHAAAWTVAAAELEGVVCPGSDECDHGVGSVARQCQICTPGSLTPLEVALFAAKGEAYRQRDAARADLARAQATIAAVRALCDEVDYDPALMPRVSTRDLRRALDGG